MRGQVRIPSHVAPSFPRESRSSTSDEEKFVGRPCYVFNPQLLRSLDDTHCSHCRFYLTARCPHIDEFLDDVDDLSPE